ncbi:MAG: hypothetical protein M0Q13_06140 [Methanothrix sp.]|jgi:hypothetical protein|nr:hypothetical protein [Methanothrix sp.]
MFKVGEYSEDEAKIVAGYLKDAGFKVDVKGLVVARKDFTVSLQGKLSSMKGRDEFSSKYERFLAAAKAVVEKASTQEDFRDLFLSELDPNWRAIKDSFDLQADLPENMDEKTPEEIGRSMAEYILALSFAEDVLNLNDIALGTPIGSSFDDPVISIPGNRNDFDADDPLRIERMDVDMKKVYEISIDESSAPFYSDIDEEFRIEYQQEFLKIMALAKVIQYLIEQPEKGKMDIEEFADRCFVEVGDRSVLSIDASLVAEEIARSLEKKGILKMKGSTIKWKA